MAARKELSGVDLAQNPLLQAVLHPLAAAPASPKVGQVWTLTTNGGTYIYNGSAARPTDAALLADGSIQIAALATNPLARANHTGTQAASTISDLATVVKAYSLDSFAAPAANVAFGGVRAVNLADPVNPQDAATKNYVDVTVQSAAAGIDSKASVRAVATSNLTLSGTQTIDGVALAAGDRVLLTAQTASAQNGVYVVASGAWARAGDADQSGEINPGAFWFVEEGSSYGKTQWRCNNTGAVTLGSTAITIVQFGAANLYTATNGVQINSSVISLLLPAGSGLTASSSGVSIDTTVVARKVSATITGDGSTSSFNVTHNLGTQDVLVAFRDSSNIAVGIDYTATNANAITVNFGSASVPANGTTYRVVIHA